MQESSDSQHPGTEPPNTVRGDGLVPYFMLACATTWSLALPAALAWSRGEAPGPLAVASIGLSAFGPLIATLLIARPRGRLREVFGRWRTGPSWVLLALLAPMAIHLTATLLFVALGGQPESWLHWPGTAEHVGALVVFPLGEEFGWRGFAHAPMVRRFGPVKGSLLLGLGWALWHLAYSITPEAGGFDLFAFTLTMLELPLYALLIAWVFERSGRSIAVALAFHAGAHLDHFERTPFSQLGLHGLHIAVVAVLALLAARSLSRSGSLRVDASAPRAAATI
ncbi:MAG: hypothetical protein JWN48_1749 [Myxococcaceae bacterium]|nr:hypothetical protein [Myxococcaceae bacterium]